MASTMLRHFLTSMLVGMLLAVSHVAAQPAADDEREQSFTLFGWVYGQSGDITVQGLDANVDVSISDSWDALQDLDGLLVGHYENRTGPKTFFADVFYARLETTSNTSLGDATFESTTLLAEIGYAFRTNKTVKPDGRMSSTEWLTGFRWTDLGMDLEGPVGVIDVTGDQGWGDLFIGGRVTGDMSDKWAYWVRGDIGGFGIANSSHFAWNLILGLDYELSQQWGLELGWRWLDYNYDTGEGDSKFKYDVLYSGPFTGLQYQW